ncbi:hypothetical protein DRP77_01245 [Candidatus Poribacteria bacterium]|nr:MAG: hypothetical protein DRP77_01245 [Candidatus Poribacteria bacterium]
MRFVKSILAAIAVMASLAFGQLSAGEEGASPAELAKRILAETKVKGGLIVHLGCADGKLTTALCANESYLVHGLDKSEANVRKAREYIKSLGLYGRVSVDLWRGKHLPYIDNLVNLIVVEGTVEVSHQELMRVLAPGGVAYFRGKKEGLRMLVKPRPEGMDEWTHYLHDPSNNAVSHDWFVGPPRRLQWVGSPRWSRHHDHMASMSALVSSGGRIFYIFDEGPTASIMLPPKWSLIARDAFNGVILWKRSIPKWFPHMWPFKSGHAQLPRRLVAIGDRVYVTLGIDAPISALDAATGKTVRTYEGTEGAEELIVSKGVIFAVVNRNPIRWEEYRQVNRGIGKEKARVAREWPWDEKERALTAIDAESGDLLWERSYRVAPLTLAADDKHVYFHDGERIICLDRETGEEVWRSEPIARKSPIPTNYGPTLVVYKDVILFTGGTRVMTALSAETGEVLWSSDYPRVGHNSPEDILVIGGLVWCGETARGRDSGEFTGRDPYTGQVKIRFLPDIDAHWFHQRCYRAKATDRYILTSRTGIEFVDFRARRWMVHHWVRGGCLYGIMPCNGLIYAPPHDCACYPEAKLCGFCALAPESPTRWNLLRRAGDGRLEKGPAYGEPMEAPQPSEDEWPTYRCDPARSGRTKSPVPTQLKRAWEVELGGRLSSPTIAEGKVFIASIDAHTLYALDAESGEVLWSYTAGGRIDSPPTIYKGRVLFGCADGWVYCLRASDGKLVWRFRAAPADLRLVAFEQVESVWPVHGSVLVWDGVVYCVAGRSAFLDGGMRLVRLDAETGELLSETVIDDRDPVTGENLQVKMRGLNMPPALPDILSCDGRYVYMRSQRFKLNGEELPPVTPSNPRDQRGEGAHLFCPFGFLDDSWFHRSYWIYGKTFMGGAGGWPQAGRFTPAGRILVFDESRVYGFGRKPQYFRWTTPLEYHLFCADKEPKLIKASKKIRVPRIEHRWSREVPILVRAMVLANGTLFIAGPPDLVDEEEAFDRYKDPEIQRKLKEQAEALEGRRGGMLLVVSASDGRDLARYELDSPPVFDGMAAAYGRLYLATMDGRLICFR